MINAHYTDAERDEADREYLAHRNMMLRNPRKAVRDAVESGRAMLLSSRPANWESYYRNGK